MTPPRVPRPGLSREHIDALVEQVGKLGSDPRAEPTSPPPRPRQTTFTGLPSALPKRPEQTQVGAAGPPAPGSAPSPRDVAPVSTTLESNEPLGVPAESLPRGHREPRIVTPPSFASPAAREAIRRDAARHGDVVREAPESSVAAPPSDPPGPVSLSERGVRVSWQTIRRVLPWLLLGTGGVGGSVLWEKIRTGLDLATASSVAREQEARKDLEGKVAKDAEALARESARVDALACRLRRQCAALDRLGYRTGSDCQGIEFLSVRLESDTVRSGPLWRAEGDCPTLPPGKP